MSAQAKAPERIWFTDGMSGPRFIPPAGLSTAYIRADLAAGLAGEQPSTIKAQGPFPGPFVAETILESIVESLTLHGYELANDPQIWCLHVQAQLRQINGGRCHG